MTTSAISTLKSHQLRETLDAIEREAFAIPPVNSWTPRIASLVIHARSLLDEAERRSSPSMEGRGMVGDNDVAAALVQLTYHNIPPDIQELLLSGDPMRDIRYGALKAALSALSTVPVELPCETCNDDPEVCASIPGSRHCEKANREASGQASGDEALREEIERLRMALELYAAEANWVGSPWQPGPATLRSGTMVRTPSAVEADNGRAARAALSRTDGKEGRG